MRIDFYLYDLHELQVWEDVRVALEKRGADARIVLEPPGISTAMGPRRNVIGDEEPSWEPLVDADRYDEIREHLQARHLPYLTRGRYDSADAVLTTQGVGWLWRYRGLKLRIADGCPLSYDARGHSEMNVGLDGVFVYGDWSQQQISRWLPENDVVVTGCPKLAPLFRGATNRTALARRFGLRPADKTVVYLATWGHGSSLDRFADTVATLGRRFNVVFKPHHQNLRFERERFESLRRSSNVLVDERERDITPFLAIADIVLVDAPSGALAEALVTGRPVVALAAAKDSSGQPFIDGLDAAVPICGDPRQLDRLVDELLLEDPFAAARRALKERLFTSFDGHDDAITADAVLALVARKQAVALTAPAQELAYATAP